MGRVARGVVPLLLPVPKATPHQTLQTRLHDNRQANQHMCFTGRPCCSTGASPATSTRPAPLASTPPLPCAPPGIAEGLRLSSTRPEPAAGSAAAAAAASGGAGMGGTPALLRTWLLSPKPEVPSYTHAGMLMALGLTGNLDRLSWTDLYRWGVGRRADATPPPPTPPHPLAHSTTATCKCAHVLVCFPAGLPRAAVGPGSGADSSPPGTLLRLPYTLPPALPAAGTFRTSTTPPPLRCCWA